MLSPKGRPYIIYRPPPGWGFWSNFTVILQGLDEADRQGMLPVVDMENHPTRYNEDSDELGTRNAWEYYFEQPAGLSLSEALALDPLDNQGSVDGPFTTDPDAVFPAPLLSRARDLIDRYIRVKPEILAKADAILQPIVQSDVLGVHVRGTDMRTGLLPEHPIPPTASTFLDQAAALDREFHFRTVFLACDEHETVEIFRGHFGSRLLVNPGHRTSASGSYPSDYHWLFAHQRHHHRYLLGLEVLLDALLLSRCGHLLCGLSNVSKSAVCFSDASQIAHVIPPLWCAPPLRGPSIGRSFLATMPSAPRPLSPLILQSHILELQQLLEITENARADVVSELESLKRRQIADQDAIAGNANSSLQALKEARKELARVKKELHESTSAVKQLQGRILQLLNGWTRLGWKLMPWTKPSWRHKPTIVQSENKTSI